MSWKSVQAPIIGAGVAAPRINRFAMVHMKGPGSPRWKWSFLNENKWRFADVSTPVRRHFVTGPTRNSRRGRRQIVSNPNGCRAFQGLIHSPAEWLGEQFKRFTGYLARRPGTRVLSMEARKIGHHKIITMNKGGTYERFTSREAEIFN